MNNPVLEETKCSPIILICQNMLLTGDYIEEER